MILQLLAQVQEPTVIESTNYFLIIAAVFGSTGFTTILNILFNRRKAKSELSLNDAQIEKIDADTASIISEAAGKLVDRITSQLEATERQNKILIEQNNLLQKEVEKLTLKVASIPELEKSVHKLESVVEALTKQLEEHGIRPVYPPIPPSF